MKTIINTKKIKLFNKPAKSKHHGYLHLIQTPDSGSQSDKFMLWLCVIFNAFTVFRGYSESAKRSLHFFFPLRVACLSAVVKITTFRICNFLFWKMQGYMYWSIFVEKVKHPRIIHKKISSQINLLESAPERCKKINRNQNGLLDTSRWTWLLKVHQDAWPQNSQISRFLYKPFSPAIF